MAQNEEETSAALEERRAIDSLRACSALSEVDSPALAALAAGAVQFSLPAGTTLFDAGTTPDGLYLVIAGRLGVRSSVGAPWTAHVSSGELVGEMSWLLAVDHSAQVIAIRDSEMLWFGKPLVDAIANRSPLFSLAVARMCARRLHQSNRRQVFAPRARIFAIVPNSPETDTATLAMQLVEELGHSGRTEFVWDVRASSHTVGWFNHIEENNEFVVYLADTSSSAWTRQCCRQADMLLLAANVRDDPRPWPTAVTDVARLSRVRMELALLHGGTFMQGAASRWIAATDASYHHHIVDDSDIERVARLLSHRGVGLVLSGGGARGFAHIGVIRAMREARVPIDFVGGASIGAIMAAGAALGWSDTEMQVRYRRSFVDTNPVNDYTFPFVALTRGAKVSRLLQREFGEITIEDLRLPFFCVSANLTTGRVMEHRSGKLRNALRAAVAIPGVLPPVFADEAVLVDGAAINNLPVDIMKSHAPGFVIGSDAGADRPFTPDYDAAEQPPLWRLFSRTRRGSRRINIFQILMRSGMVGGASNEAAQRGLADLILKPPLDDIDLLNWQAFDRSIELGYDYTRKALAGLDRLPRMRAARAPAAPAANALIARIEARMRSRRNAQ
ncbi:MAG: patatin-like phospholipase family protein [Steroidobacteraceae bacterium]